MRTLIDNARVLTVDASQRVFDPGFIVIDGRQIAAVGPMTDRPPGAFDRVVDARGMVVTPGLINMHQHLHMNLLKGLADGMLLEPWVFGLSAPCRPHIDADALRASTTLGALEMLRTGTTCVLNHQAPFDDVPDYLRLVIDAMGGVGIRQVMALGFQCKTPKMPQHPLSAEQARQQFSAIIDNNDGAHGGLTRLGLVIECNAHHTELGRSSDELVRTGHALARERNLRIAVHMSGGTLSMSMGFTKYRRQTGRSDVEYLERLGVLDARWILKHGIHFSDGDMETVKRRGASVVYTPTSESARGGGLGPWASMQRMGINCALGTDGPAVDYSVDMVEQMRACCYLQAVRYRDRDAIGAQQALQMATINSARALGLEREIGSIEPGKLADIVLFDLSRPHQRLIADPLRRLVWAARGTDTDTVFVQGHMLLQGGQFTEFARVGEVIEQAGVQGRRLAAAAGISGRAAPHWPATGAAAATQQP